MAEPVNLLDRTEAAMRLRVSERTIRRYGSLGLLDEVKIGARLVKVTEQSVERLIRDGRREHSEPAV